MIAPLTHEDALFVAEHLRAVDLRECAAVVADASPAAIAAACLNSEALPGWVCRAKDEEPVAMFGLDFVADGRVFAWLLATDRWPEVVRECTRAIRRIRDALPAREVLVVSAEFHAESHAWLKALGFVRAGHLPGYGRGGEDFVLFSGMSRGLICA